MRHISRFHGLYGQKSIQAINKKSVDALHYWKPTDSLHEESVITMHCMSGWHNIACYLYCITLSIYCTCLLIFLQEICALHARIASISQPWEPYASLAYIIAAKSPQGSVNKNIIARLLTAWMEFIEIYDYLRKVYRHQWILMLPIMTDTSVAFSVVYENQIEWRHNIFWGHAAFI